MSRKVWGAVLLMILGLACSHQQKESPVIAQVGPAKLTLDDLRDLEADSANADFMDDQIRSYVYRWVDRQVLYQAALAKKLDLRPDIRKELDQLRKDLIIQYFLDENLKQEPQISEADIQRYYDQHRDDFVRDVAEYRYFFLICKDRATANRIKRELRKGKTFEQVVKENYPDRVINQYWDSGYVPIEKVLPPVQRAVRTLKPGSLYGPVLSGGGAILIRLVERYDANSVRSLEQVRSEIEQRLRESYYREQYQKLLVSLKNRVKINYFFDRLKTGKQDTTRSNRS